MKVYKAKYNGPMASVTVPGVPGEFPKATKDWKTVDKRSYEILKKMKQFSTRYYTSRSKSKISQK